MLGIWKEWIGGSMKVKKIKAIYCPFCMKGHQLIRDVDEKIQEEVECPYCKKSFNLRELGILD